MKVLELVRKKISHWNLETIATACIINIKNVILHFSSKSSLFNVELISKHGQDIKNTEISVNNLPAAALF